MTDDALHLNRVFEESFMLVLLSFEVITNNDIELYFSHLWSLGIRDISYEIICPHDGHWIHLSLHCSCMSGCKPVICHLVVALTASLRAHIQRRG